SSVSGWPASAGPSARTTTASANTSITPSSPRSRSRCSISPLDSLAVRPIPLVDVKAQYEPLLPRIREAIDGVLASADFILGSNVAAFEGEAAAYLGVRETVGVANGTDALVL